jgi:hypothetical protein
MPTNLSGLVTSFKDGNFPSTGLTGSVNHQSLQTNFQSTVNKKTCRGKQVFLIIRYIKYLERATIHFSYSAATISRVKASGTSAKQAEVVEFEYQ